MGLSTAPDSGREPEARARYSFQTRRSAKAAVSFSLASSVSATMSPLVSLSMRCTMPGLWPSMARSDGYREASRWIRVPPGQDGQGCTVRPAGLLQTTMLSSS